jgi:aspartate aminotransferase
MGASPVEVIAREEAHFLPTAEDLKPHLAGARVLLLNSPLNPAGTAFGEAELERIVGLILDVNRARSSRGEPPLILIYDQVYWMLTFGDVKHCTPVNIDPRMRDYTLLCDGISKAFAATGLRVGWCVGPEQYIAALSAFLGHVGAWAPRPEQVATTRLLADAGAIDAYHRTMKRDVESRLRGLYEGFDAMHRDGYPVQAIAPEAAIYLSAQVKINGRRAGSRVLATNEQIRAYLLEEANLALVPFQAFGFREENGWFRLSVGALAMDDLGRAFPALRSALDKLS